MTEGLFSITGMVALVTGSTQGIGMDMALALYQAGAKVVLNGRSSEKLLKVQEDLSMKNISMAIAPFDVSNESEVISAIAQIIQQYGHIDILVNNAGITKRALLTELESNDWHAVLDTNLTGSYLVTKHVAKYMIKQNSGKIINTCSLMSELARSQTGAYAAAKGGLKMLTKSFATELAKYNIQVNGISPGYIKTPLTKTLQNDPAFNGFIVSRTPAERWGTPKDLIGTLIYLSSSASDFVNGQLIFVDGGITATIGRPENEH